MSGSDIRVATWDAVITTGELSEYDGKTVTGILHLKELLIRLDDGSVPDNFVTVKCVLTDVVVEQDDVAAAVPDFFNPLEGLMSLDGLDSTSPERCGGSFSVESTHERCVVMCAVKVCY